MINQIMLKISYGGILNYFTLKDNSSYNSLMESIIKRFHISEDDTDLIALCDEYGYQFCPDSFDYFVKIFPTSQRIFYVKLNYQKMKEEQAGDNLNLLSTIDETMRDDETTTTNYSVSSNDTKHGRRFRRPIINDDQSAYGSPVFRQNCFIGEIPTFASIGKELDLQSSKRRGSGAVRIPKRIRI